MRVLLCMVFWFYMVAATAQTEYDPDSEGVEYAETEQNRYYNSKTENTYIDENRLQRDASELDFSEVEEFTVEEEKAPDREGKKQPPSEPIIPRSSTQPMNSSTGTVLWFISFAVLLALVVYLIYYFAKKSKQIAEENESIVSSEYAIDKKRLTTLKPETELEEALKHKDYRLAVRILFLAMLQKLMLQGKISPSIEKTNMDYVREVANESEQAQVLELTQIFESVWYGHFPADEVQYQELRTKFNLLKTSQTA